MFFLSLPEGRCATTHQSMLGAQSGIEFTGSNHPGVLYILCFERNSSQLKWHTVQIRYKAGSYSRKGHCKQLHCLVLNCTWYNRRFVCRRWRHDLVVQQMTTKVRESNSLRNKRIENDYLEGILVVVVEIIEVKLNIKVYFVSSDPWDECLFGGACGSRSWWHSSCCRRRPCFCAVPHSRPGGEHPPCL